MCIFFKNRETDETGIVPYFSGLSEERFSYNGDTSEGTGFSGLAEALSVPEGQVKDDCKYYLIRKIMSGVGDLTVRYSPTAEEMNRKSGFLNDFGIGEFCVAPLYIRQFIKKKGKTKDRNKLSVIVDFPFGETSFSAKKAEVKNCAKFGIVEMTAVLPSSILSESAKEFRKQISGLSRIRAAKIFAAISVENADAQGIKNFLKSVNRSKIFGAAFIFGQTDENKFKELSDVIIKNKGAKPVKIIAEVKNVKTVYRLLRNGVYRVITPNADAICEELVVKAGFKRK